MFHTIRGISNLELAEFIGINACNFGVWFSVFIIQSGTELLLFNTTSPFLAIHVGFVLAPGQIVLDTGYFCFSLSLIIMPVCHAIHI